jgi:hypothetical protein
MTSLSDGNRSYMTKFCRALLKNIRYEVTFQCRRYADRYDITLSFKEVANGYVATAGLDTTPALDVAPGRR